MPSRSRSSRSSVPQRRPRITTSPASGAVEALADLDGGGLAGAVGTEQAEALARTDLEVEAVDGDDVTVGFAELAEDEGEGLGLPDMREV